MFFENKMIVNVNSSFLCKRKINVKQVNYFILFTLGKLRFFFITQINVKHVNFLSLDLRVNSSCLFTFYLNYVYKLKKRITLKCSRKPLRYQLGFNLKLLYKLSFIEQNLFFCSGHVQIGEFLTSLGKQLILPSTFQS